MKGELKIIYPEAGKPIRGRSYSLGSESEHDSVG